MKANLDLDEAQMKVAAEEEKKRRREIDGGLKLLSADPYRRRHGSRSHLWYRCT